MNKLGTLITLLFTQLATLANMALTFMDDVNASFEVDNKNAKKLLCCYRKVRQAAIQENLEVVGQAAAAVIDVIQIKHQPQTVVDAAITTLEEVLTELTNNEEINVTKLITLLNDFAGNIPIAEASAPEATE